MALWMSLDEAPAQKHLNPLSIFSPKFDGTGFGQHNISTCRSDATFGPSVSGCRDDNDFTLFFEETLFSIVPSCCFLVLAILRLHALYSEKAKQRSSSVVLRLSKLVCCSATTLFSKIAAHCNC